MRWVNRVNKCWLSDMQQPSWCYLLQFQQSMHLQLTKWILWWHNNTTVSAMSSVLYLMLWTFIDSVNSMKYGQSICVSEPRYLSVPWMLWLNILQLSYYFMWYLTWVMRNMWRWRSIQLHKLTTWNILVWRWSVSDMITNQPWSQIQFCNKLMSGNMRQRIQSWRCAMWWQQHSQWGWVWWNVSDRKWLEMREWNINNTRPMQKSDTTWMNHY